MKLLGTQSISISNNDFDNMTGILDKQFSEDWEDEEEGVRERK